MPRSLGVSLLIVSLLGAASWFLFFGFKNRPAPTVSLPSPSSARFELRDVTETVGLEFQHDPGPPTFFYGEMVGGGVGVADFNRDGKLDVVLRGNKPGRGHRHGGGRPTSALFLQGPDGRFRDETAASGLTDDGYAMGVAIGDVNNDGVPDVYFCNYGKDKLYLGRGDGAFRDVTESAGLDNDAFASSASFFDFDRDGRLDLYVANYVQFTSDAICKASTGRREYCKPAVYKPQVHRLYRNVSDKGRVRFDDVTKRSGVGGKAGRGLGVMLCDANNDHWPDLYVANDQDPNFLWINQRNGTFVESAALEGVSVGANGQPQASMGIAESDLDGDGEMDLAVTNVRQEYTTVYCRRAYGYQDRSGALRLGPLTRPFTGFGLAALDLDCDGTDELIQVNGRVTQMETAPGVHPPADAKDAAALNAFWGAYAERSQVLHRVGDRYEDAEKECGDFGRWVGVGRCLALGDVNEDGRPDLVTLGVAERARVFENAAPPRGSWISIRAVDPMKSSRDALGALVTVVAVDRPLTSRIRSCGSYQSASEPRAFFGLGSLKRIERVEIVWPDGDMKPEQFQAPNLDRSYTFHRGRGTKAR